MSTATNRSGYLAQDTIAALATASGGAVSILRVSGPLSFHAHLCITHTKQMVSELEPRKLIRAHIYTDSKNGSPLLDDCLFSVFPGPRSYTGEDVVEYHLHGSHFIAQRLMECLVRIGVRQALPGEFSFRAVRNGKMTLLQAEAVADLITAANDNAVSLALEKMSGTQNKYIETLASGLREIAVLGEAGIDFSDQDLDEVSLPRLKSKLEPLILLLERLEQSYGRGIRVQEGVRIAFIGAPNAGKSSLFNALLGDDRSIVSEIAGTTRDVVREQFTLQGKAKTITVRLEDTAGLRTTQHPIEKIGIALARKVAQEADLVLYIIDAAALSNGLTHQNFNEEAYLKEIFQEWDLLNQTTGHNLAKKTLGVFTKIDQIHSKDVDLVQSHGTCIGIQSWIHTSAVTGEGIAEGVETLIEACEQWTSRAPGEVLLTRLDHLQAVRRATEHLRRTQTLHSDELDLFAADIRQALNELSTLIGETLPDDILGTIFSNFCIGK
jgi:tRNA modification GTPase